jgi:translation initiation factor 1 (eIF-1/SUI1)
MAKKPKIDVRPSGSADALRHNPFGALASVSAASEKATEPLTPSPSAEAPVATPERRARLVLRREKKGRGGKTVVIVSGFGPEPEARLQGIEELAQHLKQHLGCGGAIEPRAGEAEIVIQGDQPARVAELLRARGHRVSGVTQ